MLIKKGIQASPGVAIGRAFVLDAEDQPIPRRLVPMSDVPRQHQRLNEALQKSIADIENLHSQTKAALGDELANIFNFHLGMLRDKFLLTQFEQMIDAERVTAEYAVFAVMRKQAQMYEGLSDSYIRERGRDVWDLERRILGQLLGDARTRLTQLQHDTVLVAHDLTPSQTATLDKTRIKALLTDLGGRTSHTAILAHALGIAAIVGLEDITSSVETGDTVIVDGNFGQVIIDPDASKLLEYRQALRRRRDVVLSLDEAAKLPAVTRDGSTEINVLANIEFPNEIDAAINKGANGIGLYRTEYLYLSALETPSEEDHLDSYRDAIKRLEGRPLTIRTLDLGADKMLAGMPKNAEPNPFLGCRSIRLCLQDLPLFKTQLRAILRASVDGPVKIMFPLISNVMELRQAKMVLNDVMEDLEEQNIPFATNIPIGIMIEVPSAALQAKVLAKEVDFFSIGTNDLIQYTVAADRSNERIASLYSGAHPAVLQLIKDVIRIANRQKIEVSLCGEMGGEPEFVPLLLGLGLRHISITPPGIPEVKKLIRSISIEHCKRIARKATSLDTDREVLNYIRGELAKVLPDSAGPFGI